MINPYNVLQPQGVSGARNVVLPNNYDFELTMETWWSAVQRARLYSDFTGLDALYSYTMKSSTLIRAAIDKRLRPLKSRTFGVYIDGVEDERLTQELADSALVRELVYQKGLSNFTFARVVGVNKDMETYVYPLRNLDVVNRAVKQETYDTQGKWRVKSHVNLFWLQTAYKSEDTLGLLEPICRDYINAGQSQNYWQTAAQFSAYSQKVMYYENGDEEMQKAATVAAGQVGLGKVITAGKTTDELSGKVIKDFELEDIYSGNSADTFRIYKENLDNLYECIMLVVLGSSLLLKSAKNTNSERLVRAHLKGFYDICEDDARDVQDWLNLPENKTKLSYLLNLPKLGDTNVKIKAKPSNYIDIGDVETYTKMLKDLGLFPTDAFVMKTGLDKDDVVGYENSKNVSAGNKNARKLRKEANATRSFANVVMDGAKRVFNRDKPRNGAEVE